MNDANFTKNDAREVNTIKDDAIFFCPTMPSETINGSIREFTFEEEGEYFYPIFTNEEDVKKFLNSIEYPDIYFSELPYGEIAKALNRNTAIIIDFQTVLK